MGSINLPDAESVMRAAAELLGSHLSRIPDGEVGEQFRWIAFQSNGFAGSEQLERALPESILIGALDVRSLRIKDWVDLASIVLPAFGYADAAADSSWEVFQNLQAEGVISEGSRFQVSLPTPAAVVGEFVVEEDRARFGPVYLDAICRELDRTLELVPADRLAIHWDTAVEFGFIEGSGYEKAGGTGAPWLDDV